jgi:hypothetical protein
MEIIRQTEREALEQLPSSTLFDLARNESARWVARKTATALLVERVDVRTKHPDLALLVQHVASEVLGGQPEPEPAPISSQLNLAQPEPASVQSKATHSGAPSAGFTTKNMFQDEIVQEAQNK